MPLVRQWLENPAILDMLGGDLAALAQRRLVDKFAGTNLVYREVVPRKMNQLRSELGGPSPSPIEKLLVDRILTCWLHLHYLENMYSQAQNLRPDMAKYYQQSIQRAQKNYLSAIKTLATIRKLALPALQMNFAHQQVNVLNADGSAIAQRVD